MINIKLDDVYDAFDDVTSVKIKGHCLEISENTGNLYQCTPENIKDLQKDEIDDYIVKFNEVVELYHKYDGIMMNINVCNDDGYHITIHVHMEDFPLERQIV